MNQSEEHKHSDVQKPGDLPYLKLEGKVPDEPATLAKTALDQHILLTKLTD